RLTRVQLAATLWPDEVFEVTRVRLRQELARLRRALGSAQVCLEISAQSIRLNLSGLEIDIDAFERLLAASRRAGEPAERQLLLKRALALASSPFMSGSSEDWIQVERTRLNVCRYGTVVELGELLLAGGESGEALVCARDGIDMVPEREGAHLLAVRA